MYLDASRPVLTSRSLQLSGHTLLTFNLSPAHFFLAVLLCLRPASLSRTR